MAILLRSPVEISTVIMTALPNAALSSPGRVCRRLTLNLMFYFHSGGGKACEIF